MSSAPSRPLWPETQPAPRHGDQIKCGPLTIKVGYHNGDFRHILIEDHLGRTWCEGSVPYGALREVEEASRVAS